MKRLTAQGEAALQELLIEARDELHALGLELDGQALQILSMLTVKAMGVGYSEGQINFAASAIEQGLPVVDADDEPV